MIARRSLFVAGLLITSLIGITLATAPLSPAARAEPRPGPHIRLVRATFDPLVDRPALPAPLTLGAYSSGGLYLVQFDGPIQARWKEALRRRGVQLFDYVSEYAFVAWMEPDLVAQAIDHPHVRWVGLYQPAYRLAPPLDAAKGSQTVTLLTLPTVDAEALRDRLEGLGATLHDVALNPFGGYFRLTIDAAQLPELVRLPAVLWVEPYVPPRLFNDVARGQEIIDAETVWQGLGLYGAGQIVAVADTGLDVGTDDGEMNDDFEGRILSIHDRSFDGAGDVCSGHGTHVAGSALGNGVNSGSRPAVHDYSASYAGLAPEAQLVFQAIEFALSAPDLCLLLGIPLDLNELFQQAFDDGARIHTNSWGVEASGEYTTQSQQADQFAWSHKDFTILFAAGNSGVDADEDGVVDLNSLLAPGTAKNVITVGGSENVRPTPSPNPDSGTYGGFFPDRFPVAPIFGDPIADAAVGMAAFSSRGPTVDGRIKPDLVAPSTWVLSVFSQANHPEDGGSQSDGTGEPPNRWYKYMGGTSMATPLTAGAATLMRDWLNDVAGVANPSSALIKGLLVNGATDVSPGQYGAGVTREIPGPRPNPVEGWGRVNVTEAIVPRWPRQTWYADPSAGLSTGDVVTYTASLTTPLTVVSDGETLRVTLAWTDYPGTPSAGGLVNDLDLEVLAPGGTSHFGNGTPGDRANNVEGVDILAPALGPYTVVVRAHNVAQATQPYALVVSGALEGEDCAPLDRVALQAPPAGTVGESLPFTATVAPPTATRPIHFDWDYGDGSVARGTRSTTRHVYTAPGTRVATVSAANCASASPVSATHQIQIAASDLETLTYLPLVIKR